MFDDIQQQEDLIHSHSVTSSSKPGRVLTVCNDCQTLYYLCFCCIFIPKDLYILFRTTLKNKEKTTSKV